MSTQPGAMLYTQGFGSRPENVEVPVIAKVAPTSTNVNYPVGKRWIDTVTATEYVLAAFASSGGTVTATWTLLGAGSGDLNTLTTDDLTVVTPTAGNINLAGASPLSTTGSGSTATINLSGIVPVANGGTGLATLTAHDLYVGNGTSAPTAITNGTTGQTLVAATGANPAWGAAGVPGGGTGATTLTGIVTGNGTSAMTANAVTQHGVLIGGASNAASSLGVAATGTVLAGATGADPAFTASPSVTGSVTAGTTLTATLGAITATNGNLVLGTAGNKILSTSVATTTTGGANSFGSVALVGGTATVATTAVTANSLIFATVQALGTVAVAKAIAITAKTANTSFVITSADGTDTSTIAWFIVN